MNYDEIAELLRGEGILYTEITRYKAGVNGNIVRETIHIDYFDDNDYQWTSSIKPINYEKV